MRGWIVDGFKTLQLGFHRYFKNCVRHGEIWSIQMMLTISFSVATSRIQTVVSNFQQPLDFAGCFQLTITTQYSSIQFDELFELSSKPI